ncbi:MAG TPA: hypothetical protein VK154_07270, partial [Chitinophagales bacterium]|nr:hypothetical protein [Chitinophagales bacterium]
MSIFNLPARARFVKLFVVILFTGLLPMLASAQANGDYRSNVTTGTWATAGTWQVYNSGTWSAAISAPNSTNNVLIRDGHTITIGAAASCNNLVVGGGVSGILNIGGFAITVSGTTTITSGGRINVTSATGTPKFFTGDFTNNGIWSNSGNSPITFTGDITNNGTFTSGSGAYSFSGLSKNINTTNSSALTITAITWLGSYTVSSNFAAGNPFTVTTATLSNAASTLTNNGVCVIPNLAMTNAGAVVNNSGTITVSTGMTGSGSATFNNNNGATLNYGGSGAIVPTLNASTNSNLVNYTNSGSQTVKGTTYHHLTISGSGTKTLGAATTVNRNLIVTGTATLADGSNTITGNALGTFQLGSGTGYTTTRTATNWFATNTPLANYTIDNNSTVTFSGATYTILNNIPSTYGHLVFNSVGTKTLPASFPVTVNGNLTLSSSFLNDNGNTITVKGNIASNGSHSGAGKVLLSGGAAAHGMEGSGWNNVELNDAQGATLTAAFTIGTSGTFTLNNGVVAMGNFNFFIDNPTGGLAGSGFSATKMILQNGTGNLNHIIATSGLPVTYLYPIGENTGTTEYSPVSITINANSSLTDLAFRVVDAQHPNDVSTTNYASRYWTVPNTSTTIADYSASFGYTAADIVGSETTFDVFTYNTSTLAWSYIPATAAANLVTYDGNNTDGITTTTAFTVKAPLSIPSVVTIDGVGGSAGVYANLTGTTGLFAALNQAVITGNITVNVTATPIAEPGTVALNQVNESGAGAGTYTITIQSNNSTQKVLEGNYAGVLASPGIFRLNGADRVTFNGGTGTDRRLLFRNTNTNIYAGVFQFLNDASENKINNCTVEGSITSTSLGLVHIGTSVAGGTGNDDIIITNNDIKQAGVNLPGIGISGDGFSATVENDGAEISNNNIYNIYRTSSTVAAIYINGFNTGWTISGNKIYQEAARSGSLTSSIYGIYFATTTSDGFSITDNIIGYANASGTGTTSFASTSTFRFSAISSNGTTSSVANTISNNIIDNISVTTTSGGSPTLPAFSGIMVNGGKALVDGNYIGSTSGVPSIVITGPTVTAANSPTGIGGNSTATSGVTFSNNHIGGMSYTLSSGNVAVNLTGIRVNVGNVTVTDNEIGNSTAASFLVTNTGTGSALCYGIWGGISSGYTLNITDNTIRNLATASTATTSQVAGINATSSGNYTIDGNTIHNLTSNSLSTSSTVPSVVGITATPGGSLSHSVSGNTIYALSNTNIVNSVVTGIYFTGNSTVSQINKNFIYNLRSGTGTASVINGIHIGASTAANVSNNRIRLGYDETGLPIINTSVITGILKDNTTAGNSVYYNSVYIGGTGVGVTASNTYAFRRLLAGSTDNFRNNIFVNARGNAAGGGKHYGLYLISTTNLTEDYNLIYAPGTGGVLASVNGTDQTTMTAWKAANSGLDVSSVSADPQFEDATAVTPNLKLKTNVATPAESGAIAISGLTDDFESTNIRTGYPLGLPQGGTAPDMGADEANLIPKDVLPPVITLTPVANISAACGTSQTVTVTATVTDPSGVATGSLAPTLWWRESTGTYAALLPASVSGTTYTYTLNITGVSAGQTYHYYIAAQDLASPANIGYSSGAPVHANVSATPSPINGSPSSFLVNSGTPLSGTVTVGSGGTYTTFANTGGLFEAINANGLSGDLIVLVTSNIADNNVHSLNNIAEYCGSGYTVYIRPQTATTKVVSVTAANGFGFGFIKLTGADRVIIDGSFNSGSNTAEGTGNYLTFQNNYSSTANVAGTIYMDGVCQNITIRNCNIEGRGHNLQGGNVIINTSGASSVAIDKCNIKGVTSSSVPNNLVYSAASGAGVFSITNCNLYDFSAFGGTSGTRATAILVSGTLSPSASWTISGNSIYNTFIDGQGTTTAINFSPGASSNNNQITGNYIGGREALCAGLPMNNNYGGDFIGLFVSAGNGTGTTIQGNTIQNMLADWGDGSGITAIEIGGSSRVNISGNTIGHPTLVNSLVADGGSTNLSVGTGWVYGVYSTTSSPITIDNNVIAGLASGGIYNSYVNIIEHTGTGAATITNNTLGRSYSGGSASGYNIKGIVVTSNASGHVISNNTLSFIGNSNSGGISGPTADGIQVNSSGGGTISGNKIDGLFNIGNGGFSVGLWMLGTGTWTVSNNMINLLNYSWLATYTTRKEFYGILDYTTAGSVKYYYNTVLAQGSQTGTSIFDYPSECFYKLPGSTGTGSGGATELKNNIFINSRTGDPSGSTRHYAIDNTSSVPGTNWVSNNNFLSTVNNATLGYWTGAGDVNFANWKTSTGGDANSTSAQATSGSSSATTVNPAEMFVAPSTGDLHILTTPSTAPYPYQFVSNNGATLSVTTDYDGAVRTSTPDMGADEFFICTIPVVSANTPANPTCTGNDGTIALSGLTASTTFTVTYNKNGSPVASANYTANGSGVLTITGLDGGAYNNIVVSLGAGCSSAAYPSSGSITLTNPVCGPNTWQG